MLANWIETEQVSEERIMIERALQKEKQIEMGRKVMMMMINQAIVQ